MVGRLVEINGIYYCLLCLSYKCTRLFSITEHSFSLNAKEIYFDITYAQREMSFRGYDADPENFLGSKIIISKCREKADVRRVNYFLSYFVYICTKEVKLTPFQPANLLVS